MWDVITEGKSEAELPLIRERERERKRERERANDYVCTVCICVGETQVTFPLHHVHYSFCLMLKERNIFETACMNRF